MRPLLFTCVTLCSLWWCGPASGQTDNTTAGTCAAAQGALFLDTGKVRARISNNGGLFGNPLDQSLRFGYEVPAGDGIHPMYTASLWIAGWIDQSLRAAASRYGPYEFWPGPLDEAGDPPADCAPYDRLWEIKTADIQQFLDTGHISENLRAWP